MLNYLEAWYHMMVQTLDDSDDDRHTSLCFFSPDWRWLVSFGYEWKPGSPSADILRITAVGEGPLVFRCDVMGEFPASDDVDEPTALRPAYEGMLREAFDRRSHAEAYRLLAKSVRPWEIPMYDAVLGWVDKNTGLIARQARKPGDSSEAQS